VTLRDLPIGRKFLYSTLFVTLSALTLSCGFVILNEFKTLRQGRVENVQGIIGMIAVNEVTPLIYDDEKEAAHILDAVRAEPRIVAAAVYNSNGLLYAWYPPHVATNSLPRNPVAGGIEFGGNYLHAFAPIQAVGRQVGTAYLRVDLGPTHRRFRIYVATVVAVAIGCVGLVFLLSRLLQRWVVRPLADLSATARSIAADANYSRRAPKVTSDEVGELVDSFNGMVQQIHVREVALAEAQQKLRNYAADLEREVTQRTAALEDTVRELEAFSYSISHDMRAPLRAMQGYAQLLSDEWGPKLDGEAREYLTRMERAASRLDFLIQDILTYSRISRAEMNLRPVDLDKMVADVMAEYPQFANAKNALEVASPLGKVLAHEAALSQVISNLLTNAFKFMRPGVPPRVKMWSERTGSAVRVFVQDNGIGIAEKDYERIFGIFQRAHDGREYDGTGIGLSIVKKAIEKMQGRVGVVSQVGFGTTFWFELPPAPESPGNSAL